MQTKPATRAAAEPGVRQGLGGALLAGAAANNKKAKPQLKGILSNLGKKSKKTKKPEKPVATRRRDDDEESQDDLEDDDANDEYMDAA